VYVQSAHAHKTTKESPKEEEEEGEMRAENTRPSRAGGFRIGGKTTKTVVWWCHVWRSEASLRAATSLLGWLGFVLHHESGILSLRTTHPVAKKKKKKKKQ
jgi:hypothetical protein